MGPPSEPKTPSQFRNPKDFKDIKGLAKDQAASPTNKALHELRAKLKEEGKTKKLDSLAPAIFDLIAQQYTSRKLDPPIDDIKLFLGGILPSGEEDDGQMDPCLRWHILVKAITTSESERAAKETREIIVTSWPMLAFVCLGEEKSAGQEESTGERKSFYESQCKNRARHKSDEGVTPFHLAAKRGNHAIIKIMISKLKEIFREPDANQRPDIPHDKTTLLQLVQAEEPDSGETALALAQKARYTPLETMKELLQVPGIANSDRSFAVALENGLDRAVEVFLEAGVPWTSDSIVTALKRLHHPVNLRKAGESLRSNVRDHECRLNIVKSLVSRATTPQAFNQAVVEDIIRNNLTQVWKEKSDKVPSDEIESWLLHMAVLHEKYEFVEIFVNAYPESLSRESVLPNLGDQTDKKDKYPLWYNNQKWDKKTERFIPKPPLCKQRDGDSATPRAKIRNLIVTKMIHELDMDRLPDILHRSQGAIYPFTISHPFLTKRSP